MFDKLSISIKILFSTDKHRKAEKKKKKKSKSKRPSPEKHEKGKACEKQETNEEQEEQQKTKEADMCNSTYSCRCYTSCSCSYSTCTYYLSPFRSPKHGPNCRCKSRRTYNGYSSDDDIYILPLSCDEVVSCSPRPSYDSYTYSSSSRYSYGSSSRGSRLEPYYVPLGSSSSLRRWWSRGFRYASGGGRRVTGVMKIVPRGSSGRYY